MEHLLNLNVNKQTLGLYEADHCIKEYSVSTAVNGLGETFGSEKTPRGLHQIRAMIGAGKPLNTVFLGRRPTGEIYTPQLAAQFPNRDWVLTRILWLSGLEPGFNRHNQVDSMRRYIYIHGTPDSEPMGIPRSHGCVRMRNDDVADLFERVKPGTRFYIPKQEGEHDVFG